MVLTSNTKYIYRDLATGRLIHRRLAESRPADTWVKEAFTAPVGLGTLIVEPRSGTQPVMEVTEVEGSEAPEAPVRGRVQRL